MISCESRRVFLLSAVLTCGAAISLAQTETTSSSSNPGQAIPGTSGVSSFAGSVPAKPVPGVLSLSLRDAIDRGLKQNLGVLLSSAEIRAARGRRWEQLSALLPHVTAAPYVEASKLNLSELGLTTFGGIKIPPSVGPFSYFDARAAVTQSLFDWKSINATRAANQNLKSAAYTFKDVIWLATAYNLVAIPVAGGLFVRWGLDLPMSVGAVAMSLSTIIVAANAQLLRRLNLQRAAP